MTDDDQVRRLLAASRAESGVPEDVAARLDAVLADLVTERTEPVTSAGTHVPADVVHLRRRRRQRVAGLVLAAAAVVVAGVGVAQLQPMTSDDDAGSAVESADRADERSFGQQDGAGQSSPEEEFSAFAEDSGTTSSRDDVAALASATLRDDVLALRSSDQGRTTRKGCPAPGPGEVRQVTYDGVAAALVLRPVQDASQLAEVFLCGSESPVDSVLLPAP